MRDLKFSCPSCGQHVQCDMSYAGEKIPCPGCAVLIRVPSDAQIVTKPTEPVASPSGTGVAKGTNDVPTLEDNFIANEAGAPLPPDRPLTEREQQIAAARASRPVIPTPAVKPRLSYILSGGEAPVAEENQTALKVEHKESHNPPDEKTLHE